MPYQNAYNENIAHTIHQINQRKVDHENLCNDNIDGGSRIALKTHLDTGFGPTLDLPVGSGKKPRATRKKGGDLNDVLDTVGKLAPFVPLVMGLGKKAPRKKKTGGVILGLQGPYKSGESDIPTAPLETTAVSAAKNLVLSKPTTKANMPSNIGGGVSAGGVSAGGVSAGKRPKRAPTEKMVKRNNLIKKVMSEHKLSLPQASKYIKEKNLAYLFKTFLFI